MSLAPRYDGTPIIRTDGDPGRALAPLVRQRRRFAGVLGELGEDEWGALSRCAGWTVKDVVAHLSGADRFWAASIRAGLRGAPTRFLAEFDPVATPELLVAPTRQQHSSEVLAGFDSSTDELVEVLEGLDEHGWWTMAEAPPGDLPVRLLASHALWDGWVHERDVLLPLGRTPAELDDEVAEGLRYVAALVVATALLSGAALDEALGVEATGPSTSFVLELGGDVDLHEAVPSDAPCLRGSAVVILEALSARTKFPEVPPDAWERAIRPFAAVFDTRG